MARIRLQRLRVELTSQLFHYLFSSLLLSLLSSFSSSSTTTSIYFYLFSVAACVNINLASGKRKENSLQHSHNYTNNIRRQDVILFSVCRFASHYYATIVANSPFFFSSKLTYSIPDNDAKPKYNWFIQYRHRPATAKTAEKENKGKKKQKKYRKSFNYHLHRDFEEMHTICHGVMNLKVQSHRSQWGTGVNSVWDLRQYIDYIDLFAHHMIRASVFCMSVLWRSNTNHRKEWQHILRLHYDYEQASSHSLYSHSIAVLAQSAFFGIGKMLHVWRDCMAVSWSILNHSISLHIIFVPIFIDLHVMLQTTFTLYRSRIDDAPLSSSASFICCHHTMRASHTLGRCNLLLWFDSNYYSRYKWHFQSKRLLYDVSANHSRVCLCLCVCLCIRFIAVKIRFLFHFEWPYSPIFTAVSIKFALMHSANDMKQIINIVIAGLWDFMCASVCDCA